MKRESDTTGHFVVLQHEKEDLYRVDFFNSENEARGNATGARNGKEQIVAEVLAVAVPDMKMIVKEKKPWPASKQ